MKPGFKTTEFYLSFAAMLLGAVMASGLVPSEGPWLQVLGLVASALAGLGYTGARMVLKSSEAKSAAIVAVSREGITGPTDG